MGSRMQIGNLLVDAGIISVKTLQRALTMQKGSGKRLGVLLRGLGIVTEEEVVESLAKQCNLRIVRDFAGHAFAKELLDLVPSQMALEKLIFPLKRHEGILAVAIIDPFDNASVNFLAEKTGLKIYPVLATRDDISSAIKKHYLNGKWEKSSGQKILLIDPSRLITKMYESALANEGYEVMVAPDGLDGLKVAYLNLPDLILCDQMMPRMDCRNFMHALRAHPETSHIPIILMSSKLSAEEEQRALDAGFIDFIGKPATPMHLLGRVKKIFSLLGEYRQSSERNILPVTREECPPLQRKQCM